jgi:hypothetical protein
MRATAVIADQVVLRFVYLLRNAQMCTRRYVRISPKRRYHGIRFLCTRACVRVVLRTGP